MRNFIIFSLALVPMLCVGTVCSAQPTIVWQKSLGGSYWDYAYSIAQTADGGFIVAGASRSYNGDVSGNHGGNDYWVVKLNSSGDIQWQKSLGGSSWDDAYSIAQTADGGFIVAGRSLSNDGDVSGNHGGADYWVVKLNSSGEVQWQKCLGGSSGDEALSIAQTTDGGFIVAGASCSNDGDVSGNHGYSDYWVVKLNSSGDVQWQKSLGGSNSDRAYSIAQTADGGFIVAGWSYSNDGDVSGHHGSTGYPDYWVVKLNSSGEIQWQKCLGGSDDDYAYSIAQTADGGFIVAGYSRSNDGDVSGNHGGTDYWVVKLNSSGEVQWQKCLGGSGYDAAYSISQTADGGFIVAGESWSNDGDVSGHHGSTDYPDYWVVKLNSSGEIQWQKCLGGRNDDYARSIEQTADGGFIVAGGSWSIDGDVSGNHGNADYWVVKLSAEDGISDGNKGLQPRVHTISAFPNPFNSSCAISAPAGAEVEVWDIRGSRVWGIGSITDDDAARPYTLNPMPCSVIWQPDASLPSGIYLVKATTQDGRTIWKRIVYIR